MKYFIVTMLAFFLAMPAHAQLEKSDIRTVREAEFAARNYQGEVEGSPFFNDEWETGLVLLKSGKASNMVNLKYNILHNKLWMQRNGHSYVVIPSRITGFVFVDGADRTRFTRGYRSDEYRINRNQLLRVVYDGNIKLVSRYKSSKDKQRDPFTGAVTIEFTTDQDYYLITDDGTFREVDLDKDDILEVLAGQQKALKEFARKNDLDWEEEEDLQKILGHYDNMIGDAG